MRQAPKLLALSIVAAALIQSAALAKMVYDRVNLLRTGKEVQLELSPRDPRDLFRGYYSSLDYRISRFPNRLTREEQELISRTEDDGRLRPRPVYVVLKPNDQGMYEVNAVRLADPAPVSDGVVVRGTVRDFGGLTLSIEYGIESYFLPKDQAAALDLKERDTLRVIAAVGPDGEMAIKRLLVNGQQAYEEAPF